MENYQARDFPFAFPFAVVAVVNSLLLSSYVRTGSFLSQYFMFYELNGYKAYNCWELHLCETNVAFGEVGHTAPHPHSFSDVLIFHSLLSLQWIVSSRHLSPLPLLQQVSWFPSQGDIKIILIIMAVIQAGNIWSLQVSAAMDLILIFLFFFF